MHATMIASRAPAALSTVGEGQARRHAQPSRPALQQQLHAAARTRFVGSSTQYVSGGGVLQAAVERAAATHGGSRVQARCAWSSGPACAACIATHAWECVMHPPATPQPLAAPAAARSDERRHLPEGADCQLTDYMCPLLIIPLPHRLLLLQGADAHVRNHRRVQARGGGECGDL